MMVKARTRLQLARASERPNLVQLREQANQLRVKMHWYQSFYTMTPLTTSSLHVSRMYTASFLIPTVFSPMR